MEHIFEKHADDCTDPHCNICEGGLAVCVVCGGAEGTLPTDCPGYKMDEQEQAYVMAKQIDFIGGHWANIHVSTPFTDWYQKNNIISFYGANVEMAHVAFCAGLERAAKEMDDNNEVLWAATIRGLIK